MNTWLILDGDYLCWRAYHTTGHLTYEGLSTGIAYGFLRDVLTLQEHHNTTNIAFAFDRGPSKRKTIYPNYKQRRHHGPPEKQNARKVIKDLITELAIWILPKIGFRNIFHAGGYEADDIIASLVRRTLVEHISIIVSGDKDLYQLLSPNAFIWNSLKNEPFNIHSLMDVYGVEPQHWPLVKALAGCDSDDVVGIKGVGEKTACKYVLGQLKKSSIAYQNIKRGWFVVERNLEVVSLPYPGTPTFSLKKDEVTQQGWDETLDKLGIKTLRWAGRKP